MPDGALIAGWLRARSIARGLPPPVEDHGGWRVDTNSHAEICRYVFADPTPDLAMLGQTITAPGIFIKSCCDNNVLKGMLPAHWTIQLPSWVMTGPETMSNRLPPIGYSISTEREHGVIHVRILAQDGTLAASGYAAEAAGVFVYDRIVTSPQHQRRGLGSVVMALLGAGRQSPHARPVLVATDQGRALYSALGWHVHAPYASAVILDPAP